MIRSLLVGVYIVVAFVVVGLPTLLFAWVRDDPGPVFRIGTPCVRFALRLGGVRIRVDGRERLDPDRTYLFMANHRSNVDPPVVFVAVDRRLRMLAKAELFRIPIMGAVLRLAGFVAVDRGDREAAFRAVDRGAEALRSGVDFVVFPEGTRSRDGRLLPFKKGPFVMAIKAGVPVVPVAIDGTREMLHKGGTRLTPGVARLRILEPIATEGMDLADRNRLLRTTREALAVALGTPLEGSPNP